MSISDPRYWDNKHKEKYYYYLQSDKFKVIYEYAASQLIDSGCLSILDSGCWTGMLCEALKSLDYDGEYLGYDISDSALIEARRKFSSDERFKFINHRWTDEAVQNSVDGIYFGGVFYYIDDKKSFLEKHIKAYNPKAVIIQDLDSTDLGFLDHVEVMDIHRKDFDIEINAHGSDSRNRRQVLTIKLK